jgi:hypothetical protein
MRESAFAGRFGPRPAEIRAKSKFLFPAAGELM